MYICIYAYLLFIIIFIIIINIIIIIILCVCIACLLLLKLLFGSFWALQDIMPNLQRGSAPRLQTFDSLLDRKIDFGRLGMARANRSIATYGNADGGSTCSKVSLPYLAPCGFEASNEQSSE